MLAARTLYLGVVLMGETISRSPIDDEYPALFAEMTQLARAVGAGADAEDVAQETLLNARDKLSQLRDPEQVRPWLRRSTVRRAMAARSTRRASSTAEIEVLVPADTGLGADLQAAVVRLPARERMAITLVYALGYSQDEAAAALGVRRGTVASSLFRARHKLGLTLMEYRK